MAFLKSLAERLLTGVLLFLALNVTLAHNFSSPNDIFLTILPHSFPIAVRNPYLSAWYVGGDVRLGPRAVLDSWNCQRLNWGIMIKIDDTLWDVTGIPDKITEQSRNWSTSIRDKSWLGFLKWQFRWPYGQPPPPPDPVIRNAVLHTTEFTSTHTIFSFNCDGVKLKLDYFSPVSPTDHVRQSLPFSYLTITVQNKEADANKKHSQPPKLAVYNDIDASWIGYADHTKHTFHAAGDTQIHTLTAPGGPYTETKDTNVPLWGDFIFASRPHSTSSTSYVPARDSLSSASGHAIDVRSHFRSHGRLDGKQHDWNRGDSGEDSWKSVHVSALAHDLSRPDPSQPVSFTFALGHIRDPAIDFLGQPYSHYYRCRLTDPDAIVAHVFDDHADALGESLRLDQSIKDASTAAAGTNYSAITTLTLRQVFGTLDVTIPQDMPCDLEGGLEPTVFMRDMATRGINSLDDLYASFPIFYYLNPNYLKYLLSPLLTYLSLPSTAMRKPLPPLNLGPSYPIANGPASPAPHNQPIEEAAALLILAYAFQHATNDTSFLAPYLAPLLTSAEYLLAHGAHPERQSSADTFIGPAATAPNLTNLALKSAVALSAFGSLLKTAGMPRNHTHYTLAGQSLAHALFHDRLGTDAARTHFTYLYGADDSYIVPYHLFPDKLLQLGTFPQAAFEMQDRFYPTVRGHAGTPLTNFLDRAKTDWSIWAAATAGTREERERWVADVYGFAAHGGGIQRDNAEPFGDLWGARGKDRMAAVKYRNRAVQGGVWALLALRGVMG